MSPGEFLTQFSEDFPHRGELTELALVGSGVLREFDGLTSCKQLLGIYHRRSKHIEQFSTPHAKQLRADTDFLCAELSRTESDKCAMFHIDAGSVDFLLVVDPETKRILGCLRTVSKLKVDEKTWAKLWGHSSRS